MVISTKDSARSLVANAKRFGYAIKYSHALEIISSMQGSGSYRSLAAAKNHTAPLVELNLARQPRQDALFPLGNGESIKHIAAYGSVDVLDRALLDTSLLHEYMQAGGGLLYLDSGCQSGASDRFRRLCQLSGRESDLTIIDLYRPESSLTYHPAMYGQSNEIASRIVSSLCPADDISIGSQYFRVAAVEGLTVLIDAFRSVGLSYSLRDLMLLLTSGSALANLARAVNERNAQSLPANMLSAFINQYSDEAGIDESRLKSIFGGLAGRLHSVTSGKVGKVLDTTDPQLVLFDSIQHNKIIYVRVPVMSENSIMLSVAKLFMADLKAAVQGLLMVQSMRLDQPFMVVMRDYLSYANQNDEMFFEQSSKANVVLFPTIIDVPGDEGANMPLARKLLTNCAIRLRFSSLVNEQDGIECTVSQRDQQSSVILMPLNS